MILVCGLGFFLYQRQAPSGETEVASVYKEFMDFWIIQEFESALPFTTGNAKSYVNSKAYGTSSRGNKYKRGSDGFGKIERSSIEILNSSISGDTMQMNVVYGASISWGGAIANPASPKTWKYYNQEAEMEKIGSEWKVARFSGQGTKGF